MPRTRFLGTGFAVPDRLVTNDELSRIMDTSDEWIRTRTGIQERRYVRRTWAPGRSRSWRRSYARSRRRIWRGLDDDGDPVSRPGWQ